MYRGTEIYIMACNLFSGWFLTGRFFNCSFSSFFGLFFSLFFGWSFFCLLFFLFLFFEEFWIIDLLDLINGEFVC